MAFKDDVQTSSTSLFPVVDLDGKWYSTNNVVVDGNYCKPILMNIPSIKESIDIESRKFKISRVTLEFNNFPFEGERFSDQLSSDPLINKEAIIYYKSPSDKYKAYEGIVRRITHTDEKVSVELEDLTEKKAHKDLPSTNLSASPNIQDKFKNKYVPMVYGEVDKSPLVPHYSSSEEVDDEEEGQLLEYRLKADTEPISFMESSEMIGTTEKKQSSLYFSEGETYHNVARTNASLTEPSDSGIENFRYGDTDITMDIDSVDYGDEEAASLQNDFASGFMRIYQLRRFKKIEFIEYSSMNNVGEISSEGGESFPVKMIGNIDLHKILDGFPVLLDGYNYGYFKCILEPLKAPKDLIESIDIGGIETSLVPETHLLANIEHFDFYENIPLGSTQNTFGDMPLTNNNAQPRTMLEVWGEYRAVTYNNTELDGDISTAQSNFHMFNDDFNNISGEDTLDEDSNMIWFDRVSQFDHINIGIPRHSVAITESTDNNAVFGVDTTINDAYIVQQYFVAGISEKDYYANVRGRTNRFTDNPYNYENYLIENPIDIIYDILRSELGLTADQIDINDYLEARQEHSGWKFGFTVNKKISSKELIEDIAKSTKCFPRFKNDGTFGFNTIKNSYTKSEYDSDTTQLIKGSDVISYSFSKTKPEDIVAKVDVQYNKDYSQDSYLRRTYSVGGVGLAALVAHHHYYGIEDDDLSLYTLTERAEGKHIKQAYLEFESDYIRDEETATNLMGFLYNNYKNDHLLVDIKLPLAYIDLNVGDLVKFEELLGNVKAYAIDYRVLQNVNDQYYYPLFIIVSVTKNLDSVSFKCMQLHLIALSNVIPDSDWLDISFPDSESINLPSLEEIEDDLGNNLNDDTEWVANSNVDASVVDGVHTVIESGVGGLAYSSGNFYYNPVMQMHKKYNFRFKVRIVEGDGNLEIGSGYTLVESIPLTSEYQEFSLTITANGMHYPKWITMATSSSNSVTYEIKDISIQEIVQQQIAAIDTNKKTNVSELLLNEDIDIKKAMELL